MITIQISSVNAHPMEVFKAIENRRADIEWAKQPPLPLPKYQEVKIIRNNPGMWNFIATMLKELRP